ncbi:MAG: TonB-dependent receptor [Pseudomonadota bacterium]
MFPRLSTASIFLLALLATRSASADTLEEIVVTGARSAQSTLDYAGSISAIGQGDVEAVKHQHIHELLTRVPGVWLSRGSGQEHLTAIRSPVLTGAGSCGAFLVLEDGIPVRPAGFCNVNQLFELPTEFADGIEIVRGPGNALYGSNALHGLVNVLLPDPAAATARSFSVEAGANEFVRIQAALQGKLGLPASLAFVYADDGGFRSASGYRQLKLNGKLAVDWLGGRLELGLSATGLDQETAGFIFGEDAYRDPALNRGNLNPEAFREARSQRLYGIWRKQTNAGLLDVRPYLRHSDMEFLQHFLPGQPLEENGHVSLGFLSLLSDSRGKLDWSAGLDLDLSDVFLEQTQAGPTEGSAFLVATRPPGKHYDYDVTGFAIALYGQTEYALSERLSLSTGLRVEHTRYSYRNRMLDGNTRDDGTQCGFGGCLYTRPADRSDAYTNLAPKIALRLRTGVAGSSFLRVARGFRAPQMTELYRLQSGQSVADLDSERIDSVELGYRNAGAGLSYGVTAFAMRKSNSVFRDAEGFNVSNGRSRHEGIETELDWLFGRAFELSLNLSYARHLYDFDQVANRGETFVAGRDIDTAPRWLGSGELRYAPNGAWGLALQLTAIDQYYLDAENRYQYPGHVVGNARFWLKPLNTLEIVLRLNNVADRDYADRADFAFGNYRYFPGRGREIFVEFRLRDR